MNTRVDPIPSTELNSVVGKVRVIVESLAEHGRVGLSELSRLSGVTKPSVHRICRELVDWGVVERAGDGFRLGPHLFELGQRVPARRRLRDTALPYMEELFVETRQAVHLAVADGAEVVYVERITGRAADGVPSAVAARAPMNCTATGKCILAFASGIALDDLFARPLVAATAHSLVSPASLGADLAATREQGYAVEWEEFRIGYASIAAPVREAGGAVIAAVSITAVMRQLEVRRFSRLIVEAAHGISRAFGGTHHRSQDDDI